MHISCGSGPNFDVLIIYIRNFHLQLGKFSIAIISLYPPPRLLRRSHIFTFTSRTSSGPTVLKYRFTITLKEFDIDFYLRLMWTDPRLNFTHLTNTTRLDNHILVEPPDQVWIPDVFMENSKHASFHMVTKKNEMLRLWPNGSLFYSVRYDVRSTCSVTILYFIA